MDQAHAARIARQVESLYRDESRRVLASLIRLLGDFDLAEEALHEAFAAAVAQWPQQGVPDKPRAWLVSAGRFRAIDRVRRRARFDQLQAELARSLEDQYEAQADAGDQTLPDDHLRLIFTCCHPALAPETRVALTLREVCGLTTEEIAAAFLSKPATLAQRIVRAKAKIKSAGIPYEVPERAELAQRLDSVLQVIYLVFNEGYLASRGEQLLRLDLAAEAIRLGRLLLALLPEAEVQGLLALMLLHDARKATRTTAEGELVLLEDQDRSRWDRRQIEQGASLVEQALASRRFGPYALQAAIAALHAQAPSFAQTDWPQIVGLYDVLLRIAPSPVIALNRAVAVAMRSGPQAGLALLEPLQDEPELADYYLLHAARADLLRRLDRTDEARDAYRRALELTAQGPEQRFLDRQLERLGD